MYIIHIVAFLKIEGFPCYFYSFADPHHLDADPDPVFHFDAVPDPTVNFGAGPNLTSTVMGIRIRPFELMGIRLLIKVLRICNHWPKDLPRLHCEPPWFHC
jgi:hypothetical protein